MSDRSKLQTPSMRHQRLIDSANGAEAPLTLDAASSWQAASRAYHLSRQSGKSEHAGYLFALATMRACRPELSEPELLAEVVEAIAYAGTPCSQF
jgi:hypothetical protein